MRTLAQDSIKNKEKFTSYKNVGYLEFGGNAQTLFSANYERMFLFNKNKSFSLWGRIGFGMTSNKYDKKTIFCLPTEIILSYGTKQQFYKKCMHYAEFGIGWTPYIGTSNLSDTLIPKEYKSNFDYAYFLKLSYRFVFKKNAFYQIGPLAVYESNLPNDSKLYTRFSFGFAFGFYF